MKKCALCCVALCVTSFLFSLEVDRPELQQAVSGASIEFINYVGPHTSVSTAEEIRGIGFSLADAVSGRSVAGDSNRYQIIHAVDPDVTGKLDADILVIGAGSTVDHIDNIRRILSAYLVRAYGYSESDAATLAYYVTIYNAVYRGKMNVFTERYKPVVTGYLSEENAGIATRWDQWPGKTRLVIPLNDPQFAGTLSTIDTSVLSEDEVIEKMREEDDAALDTRKDMVDLKERESEQAQERAETAQKEAAVSRTEAEQKREEARDARREADEAEKKAETARAEAEKRPDDADAQKAAEQAEKDAAEKAAVAEAKKESLAEAEQRVQEREAEAESEQTFADTKQSEALDDRKEIASDTQKVIDKEAEESRARAGETFASVIPGYALRVLDKSSLVSELVLVNLANGDTIKTSTLNSIRNRTVVEAGTSLMAVAGKKSGSGDVTLVLINPETLELIKTGNVSLSEASMLVKNGNDYYAVVEQSSGTCVIGRFDANLELKTSSTVSVLPETAITVTPRGLLVQNEKGVIRLLRATDLADQGE